MQGLVHLDLSRCPLPHNSLQPPVLRTVRVVIQPESSGWGLYRNFKFGAKPLAFVKLSPLGDLARKARYVDVFAFCHLAYINHIFSTWTKQISTHYLESC